MRLAADDALKPHVTHQPCYGAAGDIDAFSRQLSPDLANAIDTPVLLEHAPDLGSQCFVTPRPIRQPSRIGPLGQVIVVGGRGNRQDVADRLDPMLPAMHVDERHHHFDRRSSSAIAK